MPFTLLSNCCRDTLTNKLECFSPVCRAFQLQYIHLQHLQHIKIVGSKLAKPAQNRVQISAHPESKSTLMTSLLAFLNDCHLLFYTSGLAKTVQSPQPFCFAAALMTAQMDNGNVAVPLSPSTQSGSGCQMVVNFVVS